MEFSSIWYFSFWSLISLTFSTAGIYALHNANIPGSYMLEPYFVLSVSCSISYAFLYRPALEHDQQELQVAPPSNQIFLNFFADFQTLYFPLISLAASVAYATIFSRNDWNMWLVINTLVTAALLFRAVKSVMLGFKYSQTIRNFFTGFAGPLRMYPYHTFCWVLLQGSFLLSLQVTIPVLWDLRFSIISMSISFPSALLPCAARFKKLVTTSSIAAYVYQKGRFIEIVCGVLANALAQYYFRFQSLPLMLALLSLAFAWLGNLANVQPSTDFGIFQFLVTSGLQSAVALFGLHFYTFLVALVAITLMVLRWKMESVSLKHFRGRESVLRDWKRLEELYGNDGNGDQPGELSLVPAV